MARVTTMVLADYDRTVQDALMRPCVADRGGHDAQVHVLCLFYLKAQVNIQIGSAKVCYILAYDFPLASP